MADLEEDVGVFLFEVSTGVGDAVDGGEDFGFVLEVGVGEAGEVYFFALEVGVEIEKGRLVGLEDGVHTTLLLAVEAEPACGAVVVPPAAAKA